MLGATPVEDVHLSASACPNALASEDPWAQAGALNRFITADLLVDSGTAGDRITNELAGVSGSVMNSSSIATLTAGFDSTPPGQFASIVADVTTARTFRLDAARLEQINGGPVADGPHVLHILARDGSSTPLEAFDLSFVLDRTAPPVTAQLDPASDTEPVGDGMTRARTVTLTGQTEPYATVKLVGQDLSVVADGQGMFQLTGVALGQARGAQQLELVATDQAGNSASTKIGPLVGLNAQGRIGPDRYGYQALIAAAAFQDISQSGHAVLVGANDATYALTPAQLNGFTFNYYGTVYSQVYVSSNGLITFQSGEPSPFNGDLTRSPSQPAIAVLWDDLVVDGQADSAVYWEVQGSGDSQQLILQWNKVRFAEGTAPITFQALLRKRDNSIQLNYLQLASTDDHSDGAKATVGLKELPLSTYGAAYAPAGDAALGEAASGEAGVEAPGVGADHYAMTVDGVAVSGLAGATADSQQAMLPVSVQAGPNALVGSGRSVRLVRGPSAILAGLTSDTGIVGDGITSELAGIDGSLTGRAGVAELKAGIDSTSLGDYASIKGDLTSAGIFRLSHGRLEELAGHAIGEGSHVLRVVALDAGGTVLASLELPFVLDQTAPSVTGGLDPASDTYPAGDGMTSQHYVNLKGHTEPYAKVELVGGGNSTTADSAGEFTLATVPLGPGAQKFRVKVTDRAGNTTTAELASIVGVDSGVVQSAAWTHEALLVPAAFQDISPAGHATLAGVNDGYYRLTATDLAGFTFQYYGVTYGQVFFSSNGLVTFEWGDASAANGDLAHQPLQPAIAALWDDLIVAGDADSAVYWQLTGTPGDQHLIIQWHRVRYAGSSDPITFQAVLNQRDHSVELNYLQLTSQDSHSEGADATVGLRGPMLGTYGAAYGPVGGHVGEGGSVDAGGGEALAGQYAMTVDEVPVAEMSAAASSDDSLLVSHNAGPNAFLGTGHSLRLIEGCVAVEAFLNGYATGGATNALTEVDGYLDQSGPVPTVVALQAGFDAAPVDQYSNILAQVSVGGQFTLDAARLAEINGSPIAEGAHVFHLLAQDGAGNVVASCHLSFTLDTSVPAGVTIGLDPAYDTGVLGDGMTKASQRVVFRGQTEPNVDVLVTLTGAYWTHVWADANGNFTASFYTYYSSDVWGARRVHVEVVDAGGNVGSADMNVVLLNDEGRVPAAWSYYDYEAIRAAAAFQDIHETGQAVLIGSDDAYCALTSAQLAGFTFQYYGVTYDHLYVSSNGLITFGSGDSSPGNGNLVSLPNQAAIAVLWDDLVVDAADSAVYWQVQTVAGGQELVIQWHDVRYAGGSDPITFQTVLSSRDNSIRLNYLQLQTDDDSSDGADATVGLRGAYGSGWSSTVTAVMPISWDAGPNGLLDTGTSLLVVCNPPAVSAYASSSASYYSGYYREVPAVDGYVTNSTGLPIVDLVAGFDGTPASRYASIWGDVDAGGHFRLNQTRLEQINGRRIADGLHTFHVQGKDATGTVVADYEFAFTVDRVAPTGTAWLDPATDSSPVGDGMTTATSITITGQTEPNATVRLTELNQYASADATGRFSFSSITVNPGQGVHKYHLEITDSAGNVGTAAVEPILCVNAAGKIGPDHAGYQAFLTASTFHDISQTGHATLAGADNACQALTAANLAGFTFQYYGQTYDHLYFSSNGLITFQSGYDSGANGDLRSDPLQPVVAVLWDDLIVAGADDSAVYWELLGTPGAQQLVIQWQDVRFAGGEDTISFQAVLDEHDDSIQFNYRQLDTQDHHSGGAEASVGLKELPVGTYSAAYGAVGGGDFAAAAVDGAAAVGADACVMTVNDQPVGEIAAQASQQTMLPVSVNAGPNAFVATGRSIRFEADHAPPQVTAVSIADGQVFAPGDVELTIAFSEPLLASTLDSSDVTLVGQRTGAHAAGQFAYDANTFTVVLHFGALPEDNYTLTLASGDGRFEDLTGNDLDGAPSFPLPSGDGLPGGNFVVHFATDTITAPYPGTLTPQSPSGSLVWAAASESRLVSFAGDTDDFTIRLEAGQTITVAAAPAATLQPTLQWIGPEGPVTPVTPSAGTGQGVVLSMIPVAATGTYTVRVGGNAGTTGIYTLQLALNATVESEQYGGPSNDQRVDAQDLDSAFALVGGSASRAAVLGALPQGAATVDWYRLSVASSDMVTVALAADVAGAQLSVYDAAGYLAARGVAGKNLAQVVNDLVVPVSGTYSIQVSGAAAAYNLVVTKNADFDTEDNTSLATAQDLQGNPGALGYVGSPPSDSGGAFTGGQGAVATVSADLGADTYVSDRLIVRFADGLTETAQEQLARQLGGHIVRWLPIIDGAVVELLPRALGVVAALPAWSANPRVQYAEPDYLLHTYDTLPSDPRFSELWGLNNTGQTGGLADADIDAPAAWEMLTGSSTVVVADIDTGADYNHPDLAANIWVNPGEIAGNGIDDDQNGYVDDVHGIDAYNHDSNPMDDHGHGTHTAGTIGAVGNNGLGVTGVNWNVRIMPLKFLNSGGSGDTEGAIECLQYMTNMKSRYGIHIVASNNSWGGGEYSQALRDAIAASNAEGILFVAAAGNDYGNNNDLYPVYPASYDLPGIIAVAATTSTDGLASFSNYGPTSVDLGAPGQSILSTMRGNSYGYMSGTSMATPHVTGAVALLAAYSPEATSRQIKTAILNGVDQISSLAGKTLAGGRLNLARSLEMIGDRGDYYRVQAAAGDNLRFTTGTPAGGVDANSLDPKLELYDPAGNLVASDDNGAADGRNAALTYGATVSGTYTVRLLSAAGQGAYLLQVSGATGARPAFSIVHTDPPSGAAYATPPQQFVLELNDFALLSSVAAEDVLLDGTPLGALWTATDGKTLSFTLPAGLADGWHTVTVAAGAFQDVQATPVSAFSATFRLDATPPVVTASSISEGQVVPGGDLVYTATFSEPLAAGNLEASDVELIGQLTGAHVPDQMAYDAGTSTLTLRFNALPEDSQYTLRLRSGDGRFEDPLGNDLDGEPNWPLPSGNGVAGGDFLLDFSVDLASRSAVVPVRLDPLGSLMSLSDNTGYINFSGDQDATVIYATAGEKLAAVVDPQNPAATISVQLDSGATFTAAGPGEPALLPPTAITASGIHTIHVTGDVTGQFRLEIGKNLAFEGADTSHASALAIDDSLMTLAGAERYAVVGQSVASDLDEYTVSLQAGHAVDVLLAGVGAASYAGARLELLNAAGTVVATASAAPLGVATGSYDQAILGYVVPSSGVYTLRLTSPVVGQYSLVVDDSLVAESEPNDAAHNPLRSLDGVGGAAGFLGDASGVFYAADYTTDNIYAIDPATGATKLIGYAGHDISYSDLAYDGSTLYVCDVFGTDWSLGTINLTTGAATIIGPQYDANIHAMAFEGNTLYGFSYTAGLGTLNTATGRFTALPNSLPVRMIAATFDTGVGTMYALGADYCLYTITVTAGTATLVGATGVSFGSYTAGLAYSPLDGQLYVLGNDAAAGDNLYRLNKATGAATLVGVTAVGVGDGLAFIPGFDFQSLPGSPLAAESVAADDSPAVEHNNAAAAAVTASSFYVAQEHHLSNVGGYLSEPTAGAPLDIALAYLRAHCAELGLAPEDLPSYIVTDLYTTADTGLTHIYLRQTFNGLEVVGADLNVNVTSDGRVLNVGSSFVAGLGTGTAAHVKAGPQLDAGLALASLAGAFGWSLDARPEVLEIAAQTDQAALVAAPAIAADAVPGELVYVPVAGGVKLAWRFQVEPLSGAHYYQATVDVYGGQVLSWSDYVHEAQYDVFARPVENPTDGSRTLVTDPYDTTASPYGWHDTNGVPGGEFTDTRGNNVSDHDSSNYYPSGGSSLVFDFPLDLGQSPSAYRDAAITNSFYWANTAHDIFFRYGFTEAAGNFQVTNYSGAGLGNDPLVITAQDPAAQNNAWISVPPDGSSPEMSMGLFSYTSPNRDTDLESLIVVHEYGHGVSIRTTGGPSNSNSLNAPQSGGMGEGWGDWWGLMFTEKPGDTQTGRYPVGTYVLGQSSSGGGIRRYPYSYDMTADPETYGWYNSSSEVHNAGEIWCSTLWDLNWLLIDKYGFEPNVAGGYNPSTPRGNTLALKLIEDALAIQPVNPSFLDGRDAILQADLVLTGGANQSEIWQAFARRGMGYSADDGGSGWATHVTEAFDLPAVSRGQISLDKSEYTVGQTVSIVVRDIDLHGLGPIQVAVVSSIGDQEAVSLTETGLGTFTGAITTVGAVPHPGNGALEVGYGSVITATYNDADDGSGQPAVVTATASVIFVLPTGGDWYKFTVQAGQHLGFATQTPLDDPSNLPLNDLDPELLVLDPFGVPAATDQDSAADGHNAIVNFTAASSGEYLIRVGAESGTGEYLLTRLQSGTAPTISDVADQSTDEDTPLGPISFTIGDLETPAAELTVTARSSNTALVPNANIIFDGSGANRTLTITPAANQFGTTTILLTVTDGDGSFANEAFVLTVAPVNDRPTISDVADQWTNEDTPLGPISFVVDDVETPAPSLIVTASSANPSLVPNASIVCAGTGVNRTVTITPALNQFGTTTITLTVRDAEGVTASDTFLLTVNAVNDPPTISPLADLWRNSNAPIGPIGFIVGDVETPAASLTVTASSSNTVLVPNASIALGGSGADRTLTISPAAGEQGTTTITLTATDADGNSASQSFQLTIERVPPTITGTQPSLSQGMLVVGTTSLQLSFSEPVVGANAPSNYQLQSLGPDALLGTADDQVIALTAGYAGTTATLNFAALPASVYRLTVHAAITDHAGNPLDGDSVRDFVVAPGGGDLFGTASTYSTGGPSPWFVAVGDFNGDGHPDLAAANAGYGTVGVLLGSVSGSFSAPTTFLSGGYYTECVAVGDFNGDGHLDLVAANTGSNSVGILLGDGNGGFATPMTFPVEGLAASVAVGDFNDDGDLDLAVVNRGSGTIGVLLGDGNGCFSAPTTYATGGWNLFSPAVGDFNGDGHLDLAVVNSDSNTAGVLLGRGDGTFSAVKLFSTGGAEPYGVATGDLNGDGHLDLAVTNGSSGTVGVLLGTGSGEFSAPVTFLSGGISPFFVAIGDFNGDRRSDLAVANESSNVVGVLLGNGNGSFSASTTFYSGGSSPLSVAVGDFNGDGRGDLALPSYDNGTVGVLLNTYTPKSLMLNTTNGFPMDIQAVSFGAGQLVQGPSNAFDGLNRLQVAGLDYAPGVLGVMLDDSQRTLVTPAVTLVGMLVHREITVPATGEEDFARTLEVFENPTTSTITTTVRIVGNLGSDAATSVFATSDGDTELETSDQWIGTDDADGAGSPAIVHYIHGPSGLRPASVIRTGDNIEWTYILTVPAGQTVRLAHYTIVANTRAQAQAAAGALVTAQGFGGQAAAFLTEAELATLANFAFNAPPVIGALSASPDPVSERRTLTLTATGVTDPDPTGSVVSVTFYRETSGTPGLQIGAGGDTLVGADNDPAGGWSVDLSTAGLPPGTYIYYAQATDNEGLASADGTSAASTTSTVRTSLDVDVDGNGRADALTDGILILRYLFDPAGQWNYSDALGSGATRTTRTTIRTFLDDGRTTVLDVDGNGTPDALTDGILILRYLFDPAGQWNYSDALGSGATRTIRTAIKAYLDQHNPGLAPAPGLTAAGLAEEPVAQVDVASTIDGNDPASIPTAADLSPTTVGGAESVGCVTVPAPDQANDTVQNSPVLVGTSDDQLIARVAPTVLLGGDSDGILFGHATTYKESTGPANTRAQDTVLQDWKPPCGYDIPIARLAACTHLSVLVEDSEVMDELFGEGGLDWFLW